jgi:hypothetical protein
MPLKPKVPSEASDASPRDPAGFAGVWLRDTPADPDPPILVITRNTGVSYNVRRLYKQGFLTIERADRGSLHDSLLRLDSGVEFRRLNDRVLVQVDASARAESSGGTSWKSVPADYPSSHAREPAALQAWTEVAHVSRPKLIRGAILYVILGFAMWLTVSMNDYRIPMRGIIDNDRIIPWFLGFGALWSLFEAASRLWLLPTSRCFFRAGREGIWYKQPPMGMAFAPAKEVRLAWTDVIEWRPYVLRINGIPTMRTITFDTFNRDSMVRRKYGIATHPFKENQDQIVANIQAAAIDLTEA